jgi:L-aspartate oxidase
MTEHLTTSVLILGSGIAGGTAALQLAEAGIPVTLVTRAREPEDSNTYWAQGGIIHTSDEDRPELLVQDILHAGAGHSYPRAAQILAEEGPKLVQKILLERLGVPFDTNSSGEIETIKEAAHSAPRIIHVADSTGKSIEIYLLRALKAHPLVTLLTGHTAVDLITPSHHAYDRRHVYEPRTCWGAYILHQDSGQVIRILAQHTILATGGLGQIFRRTTNPKGSRGDGWAMAQRAGARVINAEFIQFHPTTFFQDGAPAFLISEAVRGAGARLVHANGQPFMEKHDPEWRDLAPRDVVARSIHREMLTHDLTHVYLDLRSYIPEAEIRRRFPGIAASCAAYGIDIATELVPIVPGAHYACGGVWVDEWGQSTLGRLYAVGEVACTGLHGANRLASTSLLEGLVWGDRAARHIAKILADTPMPDPADTPPWQPAAGDKPDPVLIGQDMRTIQQIMWNYVGLLRTTPRLARALRELRHLETEIESFYQVSALTDELVGLRNAVRTAVIVTLAAWANKQSMGCHYRPA